jgi:hypothetical protein
VMDGLNSKTHPVGQLAGVALCKVLRKQRHHSGSMRGK